MLKTTSLVYVVAGHDLMTNASQIYKGNNLIMELLVVAGIWYLVMTAIATVLQGMLERRFGSVRMVRKGGISSALLRDRPPAEEGGHGMTAVTTETTRKPTADAVIIAEQVRMTYGSHEVLKGVDLQVRSGEVSCIIGPSGSGKSTFLRCLNGLEPIHGGKLDSARRAGWIPTASRSIPGLITGAVCTVRSKTGIVFQRFNLFAHQSALDNVACAPIHVSGIPRDEARKEALEQLDRGRTC